MGACYLCASTRTVSAELASAYVLTYPDCPPDNEVVLIHHLRQLFDGVAMSYDDFCNHGHDWAEVY